MRSKHLPWLIAGDSLTLALVTVFGFATHGEIGTAGGRMLTTFLPLLTGWLLVAPHLGVYKPEYVSESRQLWRPFWAMILAAPFALWMRGAWLGTVILPNFVVILGGISALSVLAWRGIYWLIAARRLRANG